jgi:hypothetical protein
MKFLWIVLSTVLIVAQTGCETFGKKPTKGEIAVRKVNLDQLKLGDNEKKMLRLFPQARLQPFGRPDRRVFEIEKPNPYISLAVAYFMDDRLIKLELRYFNGPGAHTLTSAGGWDGLRDYMVNKFGPPSRVGESVPIQTEAGDLNPKYANFSGEWTFPKQQRMVQYIAFSSAKGGIGVVTFVDCTPFSTGQQATTTPNVRSTQSAPSSPRSAVGPVPVLAPNPGF